MSCDGRVSLGVLEPRVWLRAEQRPLCLGVVAQLVGNVSRGPGSSCGFWKGRPGPLVGSAVSGQAEGASGEELVGRAAGNAGWRAASGRAAPRGSCAKTCSHWLAQRSSSPQPVFLSIIFSVVNLFGGTQCRQLTQAGGMCGNHRFHPGPPRRTRLGAGK